MERETPDNLHYSDKGGHFASSDYWKLQRKLERQGLPFMRHVPEYEPPEFAPQVVEMQRDQEYTVRRQMRRITRNGK